MSWGVCGAALTAALATPAAQAAPGEGRGPGHRPAWTLTETGTDARFRGLAAVSNRTAWAAGSKGTVLRTTDGGRHWRDVAPPGAAEAALEFRDIEAFDARRAVVLAIGEGDASRVFRTDDGGTTWTESFRNTDARAFYDCITFFDSRHGVAMSDPVDGKFRILSTADGGRSWKVLPTAGMPDAQAGEAGFAGRRPVPGQFGVQGRLAGDGRRGHRPGAALRRPRADLDGDRFDDPGRRPGPRRLRPGVP